MEWKKNWGLNKEISLYFSEELGKMKKHMLGLPVCRVRVEASTNHMSFEH
jgi:hypothetical protein